MLLLLRGAAAEVLANTAAFTGDAIYTLRQAPLILERRWWWVENGTAHPQAEVMDVFSGDAATLAYFDGELAVALPTCVLLGKTNALLLRFAVIAGECSSSSLPAPAEDGPPRFVRFGRLTRLAYEGRGGYFAAVDAAHTAEQFSVVVGTPWHVTRAVLVGNASAPPWWVALSVAATTTASWRLLVVDADRRTVRVLQEPGQPIAYTYTTAALIDSAVLVGGSHYCAAFSDGAVRCANREVRESSSLSGGWYLLQQQSLLLLLGDLLLPTSVDLITSTTTTNTTTTCCPPGTSSSEATDARCAPCAPGFYAAVAGAVVCAACPSGISTPQRTACVAACPAHGLLPDCSACPQAGWASMDAGHSCAPCPPMTFAERGRPCAACAAGTLSVGYGNTGCAPIRTPGGNNNNAWTLHALAPTPCSTTTTSLAAARNGTVWVGCAQQLLRYEPAAPGEDVLVLVQARKLDVVRMALDGDGERWLAVQTRHDLLLVVASSSASVVVAAGANSSSLCVTSAGAVYWIDARTNALRRGATTVLVDPELMQAQGEQLRLELVAATPVMVVVLVVVVEQVQLMRLDEAQQQLVPLLSFVTTTTTTFTWMWWYEPERRLLVAQEHRELQLLSPSSPPVVLLANNATFFIIIASSGALAYDQFFRLVLLLDAPTGRLYGLAYRGDECAPNSYFVAPGACWPCAASSQYAAVGAIGGCASTTRRCLPGEFWHPTRTECALCPATLWWDGDPLVTGCRRLPGSATSTTSTMMMAAASSSSSYDYYYRLSEAQVAFDAATTAAIEETHAGVISAFLTGDDQEADWLFRADHLGAFWMLVPRSSSTSEEEVYDPDMVAVRVAPALRLPAGVPWQAYLGEPWNSVRAAWGVRGLLPLAADYVGWPAVHRCDSPVHYYALLNGKGACLRCPPGSTELGCSNSSSCPAGYFLDWLVATTTTTTASAPFCRPCPPDEYSLGDAVRRCLPKTVLGCPVGAYIQDQGATSENRCVACRACGVDELTLPSEAAAAACDGTTRRQPYVCLPGLPSVPGFALQLLFVGLEPDVRYAPCGPAPANARWTTGPRPELCYFACQPQQQPLLAYLTLLCLSSLCQTPLLGLDRIPFPYPTSALVRDGANGVCAPCAALRRPCPPNTFRPASARCANHSSSSGRRLLQQLQQQMEDTTSATTTTSEASITTTSSLLLDTVSSIMTSDATAVAMNSVTATSIANFIDSSSSLSLVATSTSTTDDAATTTTPAAVAAAGATSTSTTDDATTTNATSSTTDTETATTTTNTTDTETATTTSSTNDTSTSSTTDTTSTTDTETATTNVTSSTNDTAATSTTDDAATTPAVAAAATSSTTTTPAVAAAATSSTTTNDDEWDSYGCTAACRLPAHAVVDDNVGCGWSYCDPGWLPDANRTRCVECTRALCGPGERFQPALCAELDSTLADVCAPCPDRGPLYALLLLVGAGDDCYYDCVPGVSYRASSSSSMKGGECLPCVPDGWQSELERGSCPPGKRVGERRLAPSCPPLLGLGCVDCPTPYNTLGGTAVLAPTRDGVCRVHCRGGYHTLLAPDDALLLLPLAEEGVDPSLARCEPCERRPQATCPTCAPGTAAPTCAPCAASTECAAGAYPATCPGGGVGQATPGCLTCSNLLLLPSSRVFVTVALIQPPALRAYLLLPQPHDDEPSFLECAVTCAKDSMAIVGPDFCMACAQLPIPRRAPYRGYEASWNATPGVRWWAAPFDPPHLPPRPPAHAPERRAGLCWPILIMPQPLLLMPFDGVPFDNPNNDDVVMRRPGRRLMMQTTTITITGCPVGAYLEREAYRRCLPCPRNHFCADGDQARICPALERAPPRSSACVCLPGFRRHDHRGVCLPKPLVLAPRSRCPANHTVQRVVVGADLRRSTAAHCTPFFA